MDDTLILTIVFCAWGLAAILVMLYFHWIWSKEQRERELKKFIAESLQDWPVERALNDWFETAASEGRARYTLEDWLKTATSEGRAKYTLNDWLETATTEGLAKHRLENWLKTALASWPVREELRKQIGDIVESEVRRQLLDARLKSA